MEELVSTTVAEPNTRLAERERIAAILSCDAAKGREDLARALALESDLEPEAAKRLLGAAPVAAKPDSFAQAMAGVKNPNVGSDAGEPDDDASEVRRVVAIHKVMKGGK